MSRKLILLAPLVILVFLLFIALGGEIVRQLWNWLLPPLFGWPQVTFWQALGLLALCRILFGGRTFAMSGSRNRTPEERERFRQGIRRRFGFGASTGEGAGPGSATGGVTRPGSE